LLIPNIFAAEIVYLRALFIPATNCLVPLEKEKRELLYKENALQFFPVNGKRWQNCKSLKNKQKKSESKFLNYTNSFTFAFLKKTAGEKCKSREFFTGLTFIEFHGFFKEQNGRYLNNDNRNLKLPFALPEAVG